MASIDLVPMLPPTTKFRSWVTDKPRRRPWPASTGDRTGIDGLPTWYCIPAGTPYSLNPRPDDKRTLAAYCGAPAGIRCKCGAQLAGHDFGDEDPKAP